MPHLMIGPMFLLAHPTREPPCWMGDSEEKNIMHAWCNGIIRRACSEKQGGGTRCVMMIVEKKVPGGLKYGCGRWHHIRACRHTVKSQAFFMYFLLTLLNNNTTYYIVDGLYLPTRGLYLPTYMRLATSFPGIKVLLGKL